MFESNCVFNDNTKEINLRLYGLLLHTSNKYVISAAWVTSFYWAVAMTIPLIKLTANYRCEMRVKSLINFKILKKTWTIPWCIVLSLFSTLLLPEVSSTITSISGNYNLKVNSYVFKQQSNSLAGDIMLKCRTITERPNSVQCMHH